MLDISGELRGDLLRQGREISHVVTADSQGVVPNAPNAWGAFYRNGLVYVNDINTGLWIVKLEPKSELVPSGSKVGSLESGVESRESEVGALRP